MVLIHRLVLITDPKYATDPQTEPQNGTDLQTDPQNGTAQQSGTD